MFFRSSRETDPMEVRRGALYDRLVLFQGQSCETGFFFKSHCTPTVCSEGKKTSLIGMRGFVLLLPRLGHMVCDLSSVPAGLLAE